MGDFNLEVKMELRPDYSYKIQLGHLIELVSTNNLIQLVNFNTMSRTINGVRKESLLHIYTNELANVRNVTFKEPI